MNELQVFENNGWSVRVFDKEGEPWFAAVDVCKALDIGSEQVRRLEEDEYTLVSTQGIPGAKNPEMNIISEAGLYSLVLGSRKPEAKTFKRWVTHEVLPAIRKTGEYKATAPLSGKELIAAALVEAHKVLAESNKKIEEMAPKADFFDAVTGSSDTTDIGTVAKVLAIPGYGRNTLFEFLRYKKVLMPNNVPYQQYCSAGFFRVIESKYNKPDGSVHINFKTVVYQKGIDFIRKLVEDEQEFRPSKIPFFALDDE